MSGAWLCGAASPRPSRGTVEPPSCLAEDLAQLAVILIGLVAGSGANGRGGDRVNRASIPLSDRSRGWHAAARTAAPCAPAPFPTAPGAAPAAPPRTLLMAAEGSAVQRAPRGRAVARGPCGGVPPLL